MSGSASSGGVSDADTPNSEYGFYDVTATNISNTGLGFFHGAIGTNASHSVFTDNSRVVNITYENRPSEVVETLATLRPVDRGGYYVPRCMDGTREYIFEEIDNWLDDVNVPNILWLSGTPGAGKSAIASSMVYRLTERRRLGSNFFFRRGDVTLSDAAALWRTVAYDLTNRDPVFANAVVKTLKEGHVDFKWPDIDLHFKYLIEEPLMQSYKYSTPPVIVIDALDECDSERSQAAQRKALLNTFIRWSRLPKTFKLIITGRDDRIPDSFRAASKRMVVPTGGDVSSDVNGDIRRFFEERFAELGGSLFPEWPGQRVLHSLTARAAGLFIWAETIMRLLEQGLPDEQLELILSGDLGEEDNLTELYRQLLDMSFQGVKGRTLEVYKQVVSTIVLAKSPFHHDDLPQFLLQTKPSVKFILDRLSSVISVGTTDKRLRIGHLSFSEFICDRKRCQEAYFIDREKESRRLATSCFKQMKDMLKFNICDLETSYLRNDEVENLQERIKKKITGPLLYSCSFWAAHLRDTSGVQGVCDDLLQEVRDLLSHRLLYWLEVMSFAKEVLAASAALLTAIPWIDEFDTHLSALTRDASRFIINFDIAISESVPHIYLSALPFSPSESLIVQQYQLQFPNTLTAVSGRDKIWPAMINLYRGHTSSVNSVMFSPDGKWVVSGSADKTIRVWDVETGQVIAGPLDGHTDWVSSVAFSPDGKQVVSGSHDNTIRIWDVESGQLITVPFESHTNWVTSVAFSPDGKHVVSGSYDKTIRIWDVRTGKTTAGPFDGHTGRIDSVAISPDGKRVVSGSADMTVRIWDSETGQPTMGPLKGHTGYIISVAFSPDGTRVVSGSDDKTIYIWDVETGQVITGPIKGHTDLVNCVAFSPDGKWVVSGADDETIRIWNAENGQPAARPLKGHTDPVYSVTFSPNSMQVVSGSGDKTVRIWDVETRQENEDVSDRQTDPIVSFAFSQDGKYVVSGSVGEKIRIWDVEAGQAIPGSFRGHSRRVSSVAFLPDGKRVISASFDRTIRVWDVGNGQATAASFSGHTQRINCIALSPDGKQVVSGADDRTIRIWDVETGQTTAGPFEGHTDLVISVAFSPDNKLVASGSHDKTIRIWNLESGQMNSSPLEGHTDRVNFVSFSPNAKLIASCSADIRIWDVETGQVAAGPFEVHHDLVNSAVFSSDGRRLVSASDDGTVCVWDLETGHVIAGPFVGHSRRVYYAAFLPDGKRIISGSYDNTIRIWEMEISSSHMTSHLGVVRSIGGVRGLLHGDSGAGWLLERDVDSKSRLFWVPQPLRNGLCGIETLVVFGMRTTRLDLSRFVHGRSWTQCHSPHVKVSLYPPILIVGVPSLIQPASMGATNTSDHIGSSDAGSSELTMHRHSKNDERPSISGPDSTHVYRSFALILALLIVLLILYHLQPQIGVVWRV